MSDYELIMIVLYLCWNCFRRAAAKTAK